MSASRALYEQVSARRPLIGRNVMANHWRHHASADSCKSTTCTVQVAMLEEHLGVTHTLYFTLFEHESRKRRSRFER